MAFIKVENVVLNTTYIAAVVFDSAPVWEQERVSILIAAPQLPPVWEGDVAQISQHCEWIEFTGDAARVLRDYFSSFNNVFDLLPQCETPIAL